MLCWCLQGKYSKCFPFLTKKRSFHLCFIRLSCHIHYKAWHSQSEKVPRWFLSCICTGRLLWRVENRHTHIHIYVYLQTNRNVGQLIVNMQVPYAGLWCIWCTLLMPAYIRSNHYVSLLSLAQARENYPYCENIRPLTGTAFITTLFRSMADQLFWEVKVFLLPKVSTQLILHD